MSVDGFNADTKRFRGRLIGHAPRNRLQHFQLARRQIVGFFGRLQNLLRRVRHNRFATRDTGNPVANFGNRGVFQEDSVHIRADQFAQDIRRSSAGYDDKLRIYLPASRLDHHLKPGRARHRQIQNRAIGFLGFDHGNRADPVLSPAHDFEPSAGVQRFGEAAQGQGMVIGEQDTSSHGPNRHRLWDKASKTLASLLLVLLLWPTTQALAQTETCPVLKLQGPVTSKDLTGFISAYEDPDWQLQIDDVASALTDFKPVPSNIPDFGYTESRIWLRLCLQNDTTNIVDWRLYTHENFFQAYAVYLRRSDGRAETVMDLQEDSPFSARPIADPELIAPLVIEPGEQVDLLISYWSGGSSKVDFSIQTKASFDTLKASKTAKNFFFYGMMILLITIAFLSLLLTRQTVFLAYCGYALFALLFVMHGDGVAFQFLWPNLPLFNSNASILTGGGLIIFGAVYARVFLRTRERTPWLDKVLLTMIALTVGLIITLSPLNTQLLKQILVAISLVSFLVFAISGLVVYYSGYRDVRFYTLAWVGAMVAVTLMFLRHFSNIEIPQAMVHDSMRSVMVLDAFMMGLAIADRYNQLRKSRQTALEANLDAAQRSLNLNRRLADLQTRHELAVEMAKSRDKQIQNVVHDLRQPLHALRLSIMNPTQIEPGAAQRIESSFNYLENLIAEHLEAGPGPIVEQSVDDEPINQLGLQDILNAVAEMFRVDAEEKGLELTLRPSAHDADGDPLVLTRILSNLVSNAVKYTPTGRILIGTRKQKGKIRVEIHDTGPGMSEAEFAEASKRNVRLESGKAQAEGSGLGLAIAVDLAERHGMSIERSVLRRSGFGVALILG